MMGRVGTVLAALWVAAVFAAVAYAALSGGVDISAGTP